MVERKTKTEKTEIKKEKAKKATTKKSSLKVAQEASSVRKTRVVSKKNESADSSFSTRKIPEHSAGKESEKVPSWLIFLFIFALVFFLFSLYKVYVYGQGYNLKQTNPTPIENTITVIDEDNGYNDNTFEEIQNEDTFNIQDENTENLLTNNQNDSSFYDINEDINHIERFYHHLINNEIDEMNIMVDNPLKNSSTWITHRSKKNIGIFTKHLSDISLDNISFLEDSEIAEKVTRKYGYKLSYTIDTQNSFIEDWEITLITRNGETLISEVMCKTQGCSRSPFFWPQNYNLK